MTGKYFHLGYYFPAKIIPLYSFLPFGRKPTLEKKGRRKKSFFPSCSREYFANNAFVGFGRAWEGEEEEEEAKVLHYSEKGKRGMCLQKPPLPPLSSFLHRLHNGRGRSERVRDSAKKGSKLRPRNNYTYFDFALDFAKCCKNIRGASFLKTFGKSRGGAIIASVAQIANTARKRKRRGEGKRELRREGPLVRVTFFNIFFPITISLPAEGGGLHFFFFFFPPPFWQMVD